MVYVGIDPGVSGAFAIIAESGRIHLEPMPKFVDKPVAAWKKKPAPKLDILHLPTVFQAVADVAGPHAIYVVERVNSSPKANPMSAFNFGMAFASVLALALHHAESPDKVLQPTPKAWKGYLGLIGKTKKASINLARSLYPVTTDSIRLVKHDGLAEALLLAHYGKKICEG